MKPKRLTGPSWSYGSWIYNYLCKQCLSSLTLWVRTSFIARCTRYNTMWNNLSVTCNDITEILFKVVLKTITQKVNMLTSWPLIFQVLWVKDVNYVYLWERRIQMLQNIDNKVWFWFPWIHQGSPSYDLYLCLVILMHQV